MSKDNAPQFPTLPHDEWYILGKAFNLTDRTDNITDAKAKALYDNTNLTSLELNIEIP